MSKAQLNAVVNDFLVGLGKMRKVGGGVGSGGGASNQQSAFLTVMSAFEDEKHDYERQTNQFVV